MSEYRKVFDNDDVGDRNSGRESDFKGVGRKVFREDADMFEVGRQGRSTDERGSNFHQHAEGLGAEDYAGDMDEDESDFNELVDGIGMLGEEDGFGHVAGLNMDLQGESDASSDLQ